MTEFEIPGPVHGKGRPRFVKATGRTFTDDTTVSYENYIKTLALEALRGASPLEGPVALAIDIRKRPPASVSEKRRRFMLGGQMLPTTKPDIDNVAKLVMDALNGVAWHDDKQIVALQMTRRYAAEDSLYVAFRELVP